MQTVWGERRAISEIIEAPQYGCCGSFTLRRAGKGGVDHVIQLSQTLVSLACANCREERPVEYAIDAF